MSEKSTQRWEAIIRYKCFKDDEQDGNNDETKIDGEVDHVNVKNMARWVDDEKVYKIISLSFSD